MKEEACPLSIQFLHFAHTPGLDVQHPLVEAVVAARAR